MEINPFIITGKILPEYFCDRIEESKELVHLLNNQNNVVLISPRRMGKTGLIKFCFDKDAIKDKYFTFFIDILQTTSLREFIFLLGKEIYDSLLPKSRIIADKFIQFLKSINGRFSYDPVNNAPSFNISLGDISQPELTLKEIFQFLENSGKRCIVAIDEFQQISKYPEKNVEAILRTHIQNCSNCNFIFAGSRRHILQEMFLDSARPFYHSSTFLELFAIPKIIYSDFVEKQFIDHHKKIDTTSIHYIYDFFDGHTYYMQRVFNHAFSITSAREICDMETVINSMKYIINVNAPLYRGILSNIPENQKQVLIAIAKANIVDKPTSSEFIKNNELKSASSVQGALRKLLDMDIVTKQENNYFLTDKFLSMWINHIYGTLSF